MRILVVARGYPAPDRNAGDLRLMRLLGLLLEDAELAFCATALDWQRSAVGAESLARYRDELIASGVRVIDRTVPDLLLADAYDSVIFEFYDVAASYIGFVRCLQPRCKVVIDTVDIHFVRLLRAANVSGSLADRDRAARVREAEIATYARADLVIAVSQIEADQLSKLGLSAQITVIGILNTVHPYQTKPHAPTKSLLFVGGFTHEPNEDGIVHFCEQIFPTILAAHPDTLLRIVGNAPTHRVLDLASANVEVIGYVPDVEPYLRASDISIAPLRFGAGVKGKVGEALGYGLAVVSTSIGVEGFGLRAGEHAAVADSAEQFAIEVIRLIEDADALERMRRAGWIFFAEHFGNHAVRQEVDSMLSLLSSMMARNPSLKDRFENWLTLAWFVARTMLYRRLLWRFSS